MTRIPFRSDLFVLDGDGSLRAPRRGDLLPRVRALLRRGERRILLDLTGVSVLDAAGLGELVRAYNLARAANGMLRVLAPAGRVRTLLSRVGLLELLTTDAFGPFEMRAPWRAAR